MKKTLLMVAAVALAMTACNKEEINNNEGAADSQVPSVVVEFTASLNDAPAKTTLDIASNKTHWVGGDAISINGVKFTTAEEGASVRFTNAEELPADFSAPYIAKYPYTASGNLEIPAAQDAVIGNFDADAVAAVAYSTDNTLAFKNATSLLKFQVPEACSSVTLTSDEALAGALTITNPAEDDGLPTFSAEEKSVTISGSFVAGNDYYVAVLPGVKNNFVVRIDGYLSKTAESVNIARSTIADMKTLPEPEKFSWGLVGEHQGWVLATPTPMYKVDNNVYAVLNISLKANGFKFAKMDGKANWENDHTTFGAWKNSTDKEYYMFGSEVAYGFWYGDPLYSNNQTQKSNIGVTDFSQTYDIYVKVYNSWTDSESDGGGEGVGVKYTIVTAGTKVTYPN